MRTSVCDYLYVFKTSRRTIVGFTATVALCPEHVDDCRKRLEQLADEPGCHELVVDLDELPIVSSWILGMLACLQRSGTRVHLYHPSAEIREVLRVTRLDEILNVRCEPPKREHAGRS
ncbi:MAG: STAS domain-containing protein [Deltaproteobacteria bacterium]